LDFYFIFENVQHFSKTEKRYRMHAQGAGLIALFFLGFGVVIEANPI
jgi:hypothetical protein